MRQFVFGLVCLVLVMPATAKSSAPPLPQSAAGRPGAAYQLASSEHLRRMIGGGCLDAQPLAAPATGMAGAAPRNPPSGPPTVPGNPTNLAPIFCLSV